MKIDNLLSLFDGFSCSQIAFRDAGIEIGTCYTSEIEKIPMSVTRYHFPDTIMLGSVIDVDVSELPHIDAIVGGSPCTSLSFCGKQAGLEADTLDQYLAMKKEGEEFEGQSVLFWEYVRILKEIQAYNPDVIFFLENVRMKEVWRDRISEELGVQPIELNSNLVSAQNRWRQYWTNIKGTTKPIDRGILLKDIVHEYTDVVKDKANTVPATYEHITTNKSDIDRQSTKTIHNFVNQCTGREINMITPNFNVNPSGQGMNGWVRSVNHSKSPTITTNKGEDPKLSIPLEQYIVPFDKTLRILEKEVERGKVGYFRKDSQANRVYYIHDKAVTLTGESGGGAAKMGQYLFGCITPDRVNKRQNGQRFNEGKKFFTLTAQDKHGVLVEGYIRKLTPVECERLQTVEDNWTAQGMDENGNIVKISNSQRYKMLGNGWTIKAVSQFFSALHRVHKRDKFMEVIKCYISS